MIEPGGLVLFTLDYRDRRGTLHRVYRKWGGWRWHWMAEIKLPAGERARVPLEEIRPDPVAAIARRWRKR